MKKIIALLLCCLMLSSLLAACGSETAGYAENGVTMDQEMMEAPGEISYGSTADSSTGDSTQYADQKLIKTVTLRAETEDLDAVLTQLAEQIRALGGYTEYQNIYNGSPYNSYRTRSAELTIRIPADKLDGFLTEVEDFSNVISKTESVDDVTLQYVDVESHLEALQTEHDRLVELMEQAENLSDLLTIEERLTEVRYKLESAASQLRVMDNRVSYATIELQIDEVEVLTEVEEPTVWERISTGFMKNLRNLGDNLVDLFVWIVTFSPQLLVLAAIAALVVWLCRRGIKTRKPPKSPYANPQPPEEKQ
ncbi:MAG: DUF4349 domain-containing protein [Oscillospiraceae bacterium]|nr:DUF4349 domain-containing protein [Oscillospiraceae bacterium]